MKRVEEMDDRELENAVAAAMRKQPDERSEDDQSAWEEMNRRALRRLIEESG